MPDVHRCGFVYDPHYACGNPVEVPGTRCRWHTPEALCDHRFTVVVQWSTESVERAGREVETNRATRVACARCLTVREVPHA